MLVLLLQTAIIWFVSRRKPNAVVYLTPLIYLFMQISAAIFYRNDPVYDTENWTLETHRGLARSEVHGVISYIGFVLLFSPSMKFTAFVYIPIFIIGKVLNTAQTFDIYDSEVVYFLVLDLFQYLLLPTLLFYVMRTHDISRFYQQKTADSK